MPQGVSAAGSNGNHMAVDLHIHTTWSDGTKTPGEIVRLAAELGLSAISITDHDTTDGTVEAAEAGARQGVECISGIEFSVEHGGRSFHLLGYFVNPEDDDLVRTLRVIQEAREERNHKIVGKLVALGININYQEILVLSARGQTGRPHIAQVLVAKGAVRDIDAAFRKYLRKGGSAYVGRYVLQANEAISLISNAGGVAVLAHPGSIDNSLRKIPALIEDLVPMGLGGIEVHYPVHTSSMRNKLTVIANHYNLVVTGGSDYHGDIRPETGLAHGRNLLVPDSVVRNLKSRLKM